jgi:hypothetical protein
MFLVSNNLNISFMAKKMAPKTGGKKPGGKGC